MTFRARYSFLRGDNNHNDEYGLAHGGVSVRYSVLATSLQGANLQICDFYYHDAEENFSYTMYMMIFISAQLINRIAKTRNGIQIIVMPA